MTQNKHEVKKSIEDEACKKELEHEKHLDECEKVFGSGWQARSSCFRQLYGDMSDYVRCKNNLKTQK